jgi:hypothetical protein
MVNQTVLGCVASGLQRPEQSFLSAKDLHSRRRELSQVRQATSMRNQPSSDLKKHQEKLQNGKDKRLKAHKTQATKNNLAIPVHQSAPRDWEHTVASSFLDSSAASDGTVPSWSRACRMSGRCEDRLQEYRPLQTREMVSQRSDEKNLTKNFL